MGNDKTPLLISVVGPTAVGKTKVAIALANKLKTEIISSDSRQFYREMEIGTAKPSMQDLLEARHHFINSLSVHDQYDVGEFEKDVMALLDDLFVKYNVVVMTGGSGLYCKAVWEGLDKFPKIPEEVREGLVSEFETKGLGNLLAELEEKDGEYFSKVDQRNPQRVIRALEVIRFSKKPFSSFQNQTKSDRPFKNIKIGINLPRDVLYKRIDDRMDLMLAEGLIDEARGLFQQRKLNALQTVGYSEIFGFLEGKYDQEEAIRLLKRNSRRYAKRQLTWFKKDESIRWFHPSQEDEIFQEIDKELNT